MGYEGRFADVIEIGIKKPPWVAFEVMDLVQ